LQHLALCRRFAQLGMRGVFDVQGDMSDFEAPNYIGKHVGRSSAKLRRVEISGLDCSATPLQQYDANMTSF